MVRHGAASGRTHALDSGKGAGQDLTEERGPVKEVLVVSKVEVGAVAVCQGQVNNNPGPVEFVQCFGFPKGVLRPHSLVLIQAIYDHSQDSGLRTPRLPTQVPVNQPVVALFPQMGLPRLSAVPLVLDGPTAIMDELRVLKANAALTVLGLLAKTDAILPSLALAG